MDPESDREMEPLWNLLDEQQQTDILNVVGMSLLAGAFVIRGDQIAALCTLAIGAASGLRVTSGAFRQLSEENRGPFLLAVFAVGSVALLDIFVW